MLMKKQCKNERGQALIELIIFLPLMITLYSVIGGFASSINGSINQQKVARAYFYYRVQNNSTIPGPKSTDDFSRWTLFGMFYIGWADYLEGGRQPVMPCYKISIPFRDSPNDKCEDKYSDTKTLWVRVGTVYGVCGATYQMIGQDLYPAPEHGQISFKTVVDRSSCVIRQ